MERNVLPRYMRGSLETPEMPMHRQVSAVKYKEHLKGQGMYWHRDVC